ncbi:MAG: hypothetical protein HLX46_14250 [Corynebacterium sp.]|uniref:hypothetical protein n=1 Tax=Corynebacterium sp. TaxID=1720 RepID=UPI0017E7A1D6|nr:hypothetical protein [Corynebacterium sp.]NWO17937.1 hypothetical protein [Corynebacterium sp.]
MPTETVLDGYTLTEQHTIDHEYLLIGSPFSTQTPLFLILLLVGVLGLIAVSLTMALGKSNKPLHVSIAIVSLLLIASKYLWLPVAMAVRYSDFQLFLYSLKIYPSYWIEYTIVIGILLILGLFVMAVALRKH